MNVTAILLSAGVMVVLGVLFGVILTIADKKFKVEVDPRVEAVRACLGGANSGACGYAGCDAFADAVVAGKAPVNGCSPSGAKGAEAIAAIGSYMPLLLFVIVVGGTWLIGRASRKSMIKKFSETTCMDIFEVPGLDEFKARGWFEISPYKDMSRLVFSREPLRQGLFTASEKKGKEEQNI